LDVSEPREVVGGKGVEEKEEIVRSLFFLESPLSLPSMLCVHRFPSERRDTRKVHHDEQLYLPREIGAACSAPSGFSRNLLFEVETVKVLIFHLCAPDKSRGEDK